MALDWSSRKKLTWISALGVVIFGVVSVIVYFAFFNEDPTCFDGTQNQDERGIDCGGMCARVCTTDARSLVSLWSRSFEISPGVYSAVAYLENQNVTSGARSVSYEFRLYDENNILVTAPVTGTTFLDPNARTALFSSGVVTGNRIPTTTFFRLTSAPKWEKVSKDFSVPVVSTGDIRIEDVERAPKIFATLSNTTLRDLRNIEVIALLYDLEGNAVTASKTLVDELLRQSSTQVSFTWQKPFTQEISKVELIPRVDPFIQD